MGSCAASIHVFFEVSLLLKSWMSHFWSRGFADTSQPSSLNFPPISTKAGSRRWESITHLQNAALGSINSVIQFRPAKCDWTFLFCRLPCSRIPVWGEVWSLCLSQLSKALCGRNISTTVLWGKYQHRHANVQTVTMWACWCLAANISQVHHLNLVYWPK